MLNEAMSRYSPEFFNAETVSQDGAYFDLASIVKAHPTIVARTLVFLTVCLQQMPPEYDAANLDLQPSLQGRIDKILAAVQSLITSDDEIVTGIEGLECLILTGLYHMNSGHLRRCWLVFRRALSICQLLGFHRRLPEPNVSMETRVGREMWHQIVQADRYLALLLGLPTGCADEIFEPHETFSNPAIDTDDLLKRKLTTISTRVVERNQKDPCMAFATTQDIAERLEQLAQEVPNHEQWWAIPQQMPPFKTIQFARAMDRVLTQIWYYQLTTWLHLPYMLRASTERKYEYSRFSCLKAAREGLWRYLALRHLAGAHFCCKAIDFTSFTSATTILLHLLESSQGSDPVTSAQDQEDHSLISKVLKLMECMAAGGKEAIASQSVTVLKTLLDIIANPSRPQHSLRLTIPYFGTLTIVRPINKHLPLSNSPSSAEQPSTTAQSPSSSASSIGSKSCNISKKHESQSRLKSSDASHAIQHANSQSGIVFTPSQSCDGHVPSLTAPHDRDISSMSTPLSNDKLAVSDNENSPFGPAAPGPPTSSWQWWNNDNGFLGMQGFDPQQVDSMLFGSLLETDIDANWLGCS